MLLKINENIQIATVVQESVEKIQSENHLSDWKAKMNIKKTMMIDDSRRSSAKKEKQEH